MEPEAVYYERAALGYTLGRQLRETYASVPWIEIESHNRIPELRQRPNADFAKMKRLLVVGVRKTHRYEPNHKTSDFLVPYTSSGCSAMCLYCYLVCNYNTCSYLRLFVNREQMLWKLMRTANEADRELTFEIGSNSDLVLENTVTGNLAWTIEEFAKNGRGLITFPTKFDDVGPLLGLDHRGRTVMRMSVNPPEIIRRAELGTAPLNRRIDAVNRMAGAGYRVGLLLAPVILTGGWRQQYAALLEQLSDTLSPAVRRDAAFEIIFMTYSYVHRAINREAFPNAVELYDPDRMTGRGRGKYCYRPEPRAEAEAFLRAEIERLFGPGKILYIV